MAHVYAVAYTHTCSITNLHAVSDSPSRADIHAVSHIYALAHVDTDACAYCYCGTDTCTDCYCGTDSCTDCHGSTDTYSNGYTNAYANSDTRRHFLLRQGWGVLGCWGLGDGYR